MADEEQDSLYDGPSRSQLKREHQALQDAIKQLAEQVSLLPQIDCSESLRDGVELLSRMKPSSARNRQVRHLSKLLAKDPQAQASIEQAMHQLALQAQARNQVQHRAEYWRDNLLENNDRLQECVDELPRLEIQRTRQLLRDIARGGPQQRQTRLRRELFRLLRDAIDS